MLKVLQHDQAILYDKEKYLFISLSVRETEKCHSTSFKEQRLNF